MSLLHVHIYIVYAVISLPLPYLYSQAHSDKEWLYLLVTSIEQIELVSRV